MPRSVRTSRSIVLVNQKRWTDCCVDGGFVGTAHLLVSYDDKEAMIANAKAGGDSASRGMIVDMIIGSANYDVPSSWREGTKGISLVLRAN